MPTISADPIVPCMYISTVARWVFSLQLQTVECMFLAVCYSGRDVVVEMEDVIGIPRSFD